MKDPNEDQFFLLLEVSITVITLGIINCKNLTHPLLPKGTTCQVVVAAEVPEQNGLFLYYSRTLL